MQRFMKPGYAPRVTGHSRRVLLLPCIIHYVAKTSNIHDMYRSAHIVARYAEHHTQGGSLFVILIGYEKEEENLHKGREDSD